MKTRVIDGKPAQSYTDEWLEYNKNNFINNDFVKNWILISEYKGNFLNPFFNGTELIEGATPEEIAEQENQQKQELKKILKQQQYEELLPTDWYVVRLIETGIPIPEEILQQRQALREKYE